MSDDKRRDFLHLVNGGKGGPPGRQRTRIRCLVDELPDDVRADLDEMLADTSIGYIAISAELAKRGYNISKSSIGRYAKRNGKTALRLREIREQAQEYARLVQENQNLDLTEVATAVYMQQLMRRVVEAGDDEFAKIGIGDAGLLLDKITRASVYKARFSAARQEEIDRAADMILAQFRAELSNDPEMLAAIQQRVQASKEKAAALEEAKRGQ